MSPTMLVIGGNSGIGLATVRLLLDHGTTVLAAARTVGPLADLGIPVQSFDALNPGPLELPPSLDGLVYFPGTLSNRPETPPTLPLSWRSCFPRPRVS